MSKTKLSKKEIHRLKQKQSFEIATQVRLLAESLASQAQLDTVLNQESDLAKKQALFDFMRPFIKRFTPERPSAILRPEGIIKP